MEYPHEAYQGGGRVIILSAIPELVLEFDQLPPTANHAFTVNRYNHRIIPTTEAQKYMQWAQQETEEQKGEWVWRGSYLRLLFQVFTPTNVRGDLSNYKKILEDGIKKGLGVDDKWNLWTDLQPKIDRQSGPRCVIAIYQNHQQAILEIPELVTTGALIG